MNVFTLKPDANQFQGIVFADEEDAELLARLFDGMPIGERWRPLRVEIETEDEVHGELSPGDFPSFLSRAPVFSKRALEAIREVLHGQGEILPLDCGQDEYYAFNVTRLVDALDQKSSKVKRFKSSGRIMVVEKYVLRKDRVGSAAIFKLPEVPTMDVFVTDRFVERWTQAGLKGAVFEPI